VERKSEEGVESFLLSYDVFENMKQNRRRECLSDSIPDSLGIDAKSLMGRDPPQNLLPSKHDLPRLVLVLALASLVAWTCNLLFTSLLHPPSKPFCDTNFDSPDYSPGFSLSLSLSFIFFYVPWFSCISYDSVLCVELFIWWLI